MILNRHNRVRQIGDFHWRQHRRGKIISPMPIAAVPPSPLIMKGDQYVSGLPVDWESGKTICFLTRCHPARPNMQRVCIDSVALQTCGDYQHFLIQDTMRESDEFSRGDGQFAIEHGLTKPWPIDAHYVMVLDDDNMLTDIEFVKDFKELAQKENPDVVIFKGEIKGSGIYPPDTLWGKPPIAGCIDWFCFAIKKEIWERYIKEIETHPNLRTNCNDFLLIETCYRNTKSVIWFNRLVAATQRGPGRLRAETEF